MRLICVDPGIGRCGYAIAEKAESPYLVKILAAGTATTPKEMAFVDRLCLISKLIGLVVEKYQPESLVIEETPPRGAVGATLCQAKGAILTNFGGFKIHSVYPGTVKMIVAGHGNASKEVVREFSKSKALLCEGVKVMDSKDDTWDAIALAVYAFTPKVGRKK